jgi:hypothetical protein
MQEHTYRHTIRKRSEIRKSALGGAQFILVFPRRLVLCNHIHDVRGNQAGKFGKGEGACRVISCNLTLLSNESTSRLKVCNAKQ